MLTIEVDGKKYKVSKRDNLLKACLSLSLDIPYFCWHPELGSIGACRQCAVKQYQNAEDKKGRLIMSCMTSVTEGVCISIEDEEAKQFRKSIIECLMINHPHDCPVCEEGGNCHLQDMTVMTGHNFRRYRFTKRTHRNQNLGPFVSHEMNRCITCYRCIRYYKDYADGQDLGVYGISNNIYFGRLNDGPLENEFSGNLVEICPTGVFTDKTYSEHYNRKWDMQFSPSICQHCSIGCNISPGERYGKLCRIENRYNGSINHYFLCDRGRFGYGYVNLNDRPRQPIQRHGNSLTVLNVKQALQFTENALRHLKKVIGIGSPRASIESNFALRELVGSENFCAGIPYAEQERLKLMLKILKESGIRTPTLREIESYDAILILGEDVTQTGARVALAIRQAIKGKMRAMAEEQKIPDWQIAAVMNIGQCAKYPLFITSVDSTNLDDISTWSYYAPIEDQARLGFAIAHALDKEAPNVEDFNCDLYKKVNIIVEALVNAKKPLIISGTNTCSIEILQASSNIAKALKKHGSDVGITMITESVNSVGIGMIGGCSLEQALNKLKSKEADGVIILENDLHRHISDIYIDEVFSDLSFLVVIDHQNTKIMNKANLILSAASFAESNGTVINNEGRAQRFFQVYDPKYYDSSTAMLASWKWLYLLHNTIKDRIITDVCIQFDHVINMIAEKLPHMAGIKDVAPNADFRIHGQKFARKPHRYSGQVAISTITNSNGTYESYQSKDKDTMFTFSMEGNNQPCAPRSEIPFAWSPGWNSPQAWNKFQIEVGGCLRYGDPGVRLIDVTKQNLDYFTEIPSSFKSEKNSLRITPYYHLFGSDELSKRSPIFQKRISNPYIKLNLIDAKKFGFTEGSNISFSYEGRTVILPLLLSEWLTEGQVGLPVGVVEIPVKAGARLYNLQEVLL